MSRSLPRRRDGQMGRIACSMAFLLLTGIGHVQQARAYHAAGAAAEQLEVILAGSHAHRASLKSARIRYTVADGQTPSREAGLRGQFSPNPKPVVAQILLAFDGDVYRREKVYDPADIERYTIKLGHQTGVRYNNEFSIWNSQIAIRYDGDTQFIVDRSDKTAYSEISPLNIGMASDLHVRVNFLRSEPGGSARYLGEVERNGRKLSRIEVKGSGVQRDEYLVDCERGFMPVEISTYFDPSEQPAHIVKVEELKEYAPGIWLPTVYYKVDILSKPHQLFAVTTQEVEVQPKFPSGYFELRRPPSENRTVSNVLTNKALYTKTGRITLEAFRSDGTLLPNPDIAEPSSSGTRSKAASKSAKVDRPPATSEVAQWPFGPQPDDSTMRWWLAALAAVLAIAAIVIWRLKKK